MGADAMGRQATRHPVLAAVRAQPLPEPALLAAASIAAWWNAPVHAITVVEPLGNFAAEAELSGLLAEAEREHETRARPALERNVADVAGPDALPRGEWVATVARGSAPHAIADAARAAHARLVVMGLGRHALLDRLFGSETAVRTARVLAQPLLAVGRSISAPYDRIVVASDFSPAATAAAQYALTLLAPGGTLSLVHVAARLEAEPAAWLSVHERVVPGLFADQIRQIAAPDGVHVEWTQRTGAPATEVLEVAERADAPLVAVGRHGIGPVERLFVGSTSTALLRRSERGVLVVPTG
jgi:nucleotide-binding universal stress UspA family protein